LARTGNVIATITAIHTTMTGLTTRIENCFFIFWSFKFLSFILTSCGPKLSHQNFRLALVRDLKQERGWVPQPHTSHSKEQLLPPVNWQDMTWDIENTSPQKKTSPLPWVFHKKQKKTYEQNSDVRNQIQGCKLIPASQHTTQNRMFEDCLTLQSEKQKTNCNYCN
jgi:hypothetical protein